MPVQTQPEDESFSARNYLHRHVYIFEYVYTYKYLPPNLTVLVEKKLVLHLKTVFSQRCYLHTPRYSQRKPFSVTFCIKLSNNIAICFLYSFNWALLYMSYLPTSSLGLRSANESRSHRLTKTFFERFAEISQQLLTSCTLKNSRHLMTSPNNCKGFCCEGAGSTAISSSEYLEALTWPTGFHVIPCCGQASQPQDHADRFIILFIKRYMLKTLCTPVCNLGALCGHPASSSYRYITQIPSITTTSNSVPSKCFIRNKTPTVTYWNVHQIFIKFVIKTYSKYQHQSGMKWHLPVSLT